MSQDDGQGPGSPGGAVSYKNPIDDDDDENDGGKSGAVLLPVGDFVKPTGICNAIFWPDLDENDAKEWMALKRAGKAGCLLHPDSAFRKYWDIFSMALIIYSCITIPYRLGFNVEATGNYAIMDAFVDCVFMVDICFTFRTAIFDSEDKVVVEFQVIKKAYLRGWFWPDFVSSFPFDALLNAGGEEDGDAARVMKLIRIFRMVKILRMVRIKRLLKKFQDEMSIKNGVMISLKFAMVTIMASHFLACLWFSKVMESPENNWALRYCVWADKDHYNNDCSYDVCRVQSCEAACGGSSRDFYNQDTGRMEIVLPPPHLTDVNGEDQTVDECLEGCVACDPMVQYRSSIYFALVTMTTIGYGDVLPTTTSERYFTTVAMLVGASIFAYAITNMCTVVHNLNPADVYVKGRMDDLVDLINFLGLNSHMRHKIMELFFFKSNASTSVHHNEDAILMSMSKAQRQEIRLLSVRKQMEAVPFFKKFDIKAEDPLVAEKNNRIMGLLAMALDSGPRSPGDIICKQGTPANAMHIVVGGQAQITRNNVKIANVGDCCCLVATALFRPCIHVYSATVTEFLDVYSLTRVEIRRIFDYCDESLLELEAHAVEVGVCKTDCSDFTVHEVVEDGSHQCKPFSDPRSDDELEAIRQKSLQMYTDRKKLQEEYIQILTASISGL